FSLKGKNAAITGAGGAIGTQTAISFAEAGASTILLSDVSREALDRLQKLLDSKSSYSATCFLYQICNVSNDEQVAELLAKLDEHGGLDIMVNNAGDFP
ncbi:NAD(P)-binding protein, partial [Clathrospora elynae]